MKKEKQIITIALVYFIILSSTFGILFTVYWTGNLEIPLFGPCTPTPINDIDEDRLHNRPHTYINSISSLEISSVTDLYLPKFFNNDNISLYFPEGDEYAYSIGIRQDDPSGSLVIYSTNGSELSRSRWESGAGSLGYAAYSVILRFEGGETLTLNFSGSGIVAFSSESTSDMFRDSPDYSGVVGNGTVAFILPTQLTSNLPINRRIVAETSPISGSEYKVRFFSSDLRLLAEAQGTQNTKIQIPSGRSYIVIAVVESQGNISLRFTYSDPIPGRLNFIGRFFLGGFIISLICMITTIGLYWRTLFKKEKLSFNLGK